MSPRVEWATQKIMQKWEIKDAIFSLIKSNAVHLISRVIVRHINAINWELSSMWNWVNFECMWKWQSIGKCTFEMVMCGVCVVSPSHSHPFINWIKLPMQIAGLAHTHTHTLDNVVAFSISKCFACNCMCELRSVKREIKIWWYVRASDVHE